MRRPLSIVAALLAASAIAPPVLAANTGHPALRLVSRRPVVISGQHFRARERVRLVPSNGPAVSVHASPAGTFRVTLTRTLISRCSGFSLRATGTRGSVANLKIPRPECLPASST